MKHKRKRRQLSTNYHLSRKCDFIIGRLTEIHRCLQIYPSAYIEAIDSMNTAADELRELCNKRRRYEF